MVHRLVIQYLTLFPEPLGSFFMPKIGLYTCFNEPTKGGDSYGSPLHLRFWNPFLVRFILHDSNLDSSNCWKHPVRMVHRKVGDCNEIT